MTTSGVRSSSIDRLPSDQAEPGFSYSTPDQSKLQRAIIRTVEQIGGQPRLRRLYEGRHDRRREGETFFDTAVRLLALDLRYNAVALASIPVEGPVLFIANHPYGVLDGIVLASLMLKVRPDSKVLAHAALNRVPEAVENLLPVDFTGTPAALHTNLSTRGQALAWLSEGHAIGIFPGGGVATSEKWSGSRAYELPWAPFTAKLIRSSGATVVPVHFSGQNSRLFQIASHISQTLRLSLLMRETARRIGTRFDVGIGEPIAPAELARFSDRNAMLRDLRRRTCALGPNGEQACMRNGRIRQSRSERLQRERAAA